MQRPPALAGGCLKSLPNPVEGARHLRLDTFDWTIVVGLPAAVEGGRCLRWPPLTSKVPPTSKVSDTSDRTPSIAEAVIARSPNPRARVAARLVGGVECSCSFARRRLQKLLGNPGIAYRSALEAARHLRWTSPVRGARPDARRAYPTRARSSRSKFSFSQACARWKWWKRRSCSMNSGGCTHRRPSSPRRAR